MDLSALAGFSPVAQAAGHELSAAFAVLARVAAPIAVAALWQGAAVAAGLALCLRLMPRLSGAHRFSVWAGGFAVVAGLPVLPLLLHPAAASGATLASSAATRSWITLDARWTLAIAALWLVLALARAVDLAVHTLRLGKLWKDASPIDGDFSGILAAGANGRRRVAVCISREIDRPSVIGFLAPRVLIPDWLSARLTPGELEQVILHECEHLRRRDDWTNLLQKLALVLFPLNPALAWMEHRLCREREMACDEGVVRVTRAPRAYAACLASMAERQLKHNRDRNLAGRASAALSLGVFERRSELAGRVHSILWRKKMLSPLGSRALVSVLGCGLLLGAAELARLPQMVAFVSAPDAEAQTARLPQAQNSPERLVTLDGRSAEAFRAINAIAVVPSASPRAVKSGIRRNGAARPEAVAGAKAIREANQPGLALAESRRTMTDAETASSVTPGAAPEAAVPQQWIVLTTWEQVETPGTGSGKVQDFSADADSDAASPAQPGKSSTRQITVTQLILRVYPASAGAAPGGNSQAAGKNSARPNTGFNSVLHQQAILPLSSGWLIIQL